MSFADVNHFDAHRCTFQNVGRNLVNITIQVFPPSPSEPSSLSPLSSEPQVHHLTDTTTLSSLSNIQNSYESVIARLHQLNVDVTPKRDFLLDLPNAVTLRVLSCVNDPRTLVRMSQVSKHWRSLLSDEHVWRRMCATFGFDADQVEAVAFSLVGAANGEIEIPIELVTPMAGTKVSHHPTVSATPKGSKPHIRDVPVI